MLNRQVQESVASFAAAYSLGEKESKAALALLKEVPADIKEGLTGLVRPIHYYSFFNVF